MTTSFTDTPTTALSNPTIDVLMSHCTVRRLSEQPLSDDQMTTLLDVAKRAPTSSYRQQFSIIRITDPAIREALREISTQPYVGGTRGELVIFVADLHRNARIREAAGQDTEILSSANLFLAATEDALIAAHNMMVAAESMGLGTVYLGSFLRKPQEVIDLLGLPPLTFPIVGRCPVPSARAALDFCWRKRLPERGHVRAGSGRVRPGGAGVLQLASQ